CTESKDITGIRSYDEVIRMPEIIVAGDKVPENFGIAIGLKRPKREFPVVLEFSHAPGPMPGGVSRLEHVVPSMSDTCRHKRLP
ncbi:MAG TPA: hypothetical protein VFH21_01720, partial [Burkholderiales bacterium]|nr:hypothetical protein [Burkholderiales bacterium]